jgi:hypothetical protein
MMQREPVAGIGPVYVAQWMHRLIALLVAPLLLVVGSDAVVALEPTAEPDVQGHRVEIPEAGLAITLPADWDVTVPMEELDVPGELEGMDLPAGYQWAAEIDLAQVSGWLVLMATGPTVYPEPGSGGCWISSVRVDDPATDWPVTLAEVRWADALAYWNGPRFEHTRAELRLNAGPADTVEFAEQDTDGDWHGVSYRLAAPHGIVELTCSAFGEPDRERWRAIAETLEFLPGGPVPAARFGITFPDHWTVRQLTAEEVHSMFRVFPRHERPLLRARLLAERPDGEESCRVVDRSAAEAVRSEARSIEETMAADIAASQAASTHAVVDSAILDLPAGRAGRVDVLVGGSVAISWYHLTDGRSWFYLQCGAREPPDDRWLSIAESFELLPLEG